MSDLLDLSILSTLKDVIGDDLNDIIDSFLELLPGQTLAIEQAVKDSDANALRLHAHTLKGSASNVGASALAAISLTIESIAKQGQTQEAATHISTLKSCAEQSAKALKDFMGH